MSAPPARKWLLGGEGANFVQDVLTKATDPVEAVAKVQTACALTHGGCAPLLELLDTLGCARSDAYGVSLLAARAELLQRIPTLPQDALLRLLEARAPSRRQPQTRRHLSRQLAAAFVACSPSATEAAPALLLADATRRSPERSAARPTGAHPLERRRPSPSSRWRSCTRCRSRCSAACGPCRQPSSSRRVLRATALRPSPTRTSDAADEPPRASPAAPHAPRSSGRTWTSSASCRAP